MANSSGESSDEFYDANEDIASRNSDDEENSPVWPSFSQPKILQNLPPAIPPPPQRNGGNNVPFLPAPPCAGTPRTRPSRAYQQQQATTPQREFLERRISVSSSGSGGGAASRSEFFPRVHLNPASTANDDTPSKRRRKLDELRARLRSFEIDDDEKERKARAEGDKCSPPSDTSSTSDLSSLASWSKNFLTSSYNNGGNAEKTIVCENPQTSPAAASSPLSPKIDSTEAPRAVSCENATLLKSSNQPVTDSNSHNDSVLRSTLDSVAQKIAASSSSSSSAATSKTSTLEKSDEFIAAMANPGVFSVNPHRRPSSARSSKSNSLSKDVTSISACEHFLYANDTDDPATLARKNSEAAEVIEALTSEIVRKAEIEREQLRKSTSSIPDVPDENAEDDYVAAAAAATAAASSDVSGPSAVSAGKRSATEGELRRRSGRSGGGSVREPDIIMSNRVKTGDTGASVDGEDAVPPPVIVKPPRGRRSVDAKAAATSSVSPAAEAETAPTLAQPPAHSPEVASTAHDAADEGALTSIMLKNLDTGEKVPLIAFDEKSSQRPCINPLALHIMQLTGDDGCAGSDCADTDSESMISSEDVGSLRGAWMKDHYLNFAKQRTAHYRKAIGKKVGRAMHKTVSAMKHVKEGVSQHWRKEDSSQSDEEDNSESSKVIRVRASHHHKGPYHFDQIKLAQDLSGEHTGSVWSMKFSHCGRVMATAGQDKDIRIWVLKESFNYFNNMRLKYSVADTENFNSAFRSPLSEEPSCHTLSHSTSMSSVYMGQGDDVRRCRSNTDLFGNSDSISMCSAATSASTSTQNDDALAPFVQKPFCVFKGHSADVLDLCWSKNFFLLSSSMDRTVRLWHISRKECLCCFQHAEFVTAIAFLPKDDRYFLSVSLDGKLRVWHIPEKKVALWNEVEGGKLITALTFARNGKFVVVGTTDGRCVFYTTEQLKYHTQIDVKSSHGKNSRGHKVTGLESFQDKLLVTSSDSRVRLYDTRDLSLTCKYKGYCNYGSQIRASFSHDGRYIVCGSEDKNVYLWKTVVDTDMLSLSVRKDRNRRWESIRAHNAVVTAAVFAPRPDLIFQQIEERKRRVSNVDQSSTMELRLPGVRAMAATAGEVLVTADFGGAIYVFFNKPKVKLGSSVFLPSY